jgi:hypothetical protein
VGGAATVTHHQVLLEPQAVLVAVEDTQIKAAGQERLGKVTQAAQAL